jgi:hypothetical protein
MSLSLYSVAMADSEMKILQRTGKLDAPVIHAPSALAET